MRHTGLTDQTNRQNDVIFVAESKDRDYTNRKYTKHTFVAESKDRDATKVGGSCTFASNRRRRPTGTST